LRTAIQTTWHFGADWKNESSTIVWTSISETQQEERTMAPTSVHTDLAPKAQGPYSQAIVHGGLVYCAGQIPLDPATGKLVSGTIDVHTTRVLKNLDAVLKEAGSDSSLVLRTTVYLADIADFAAMNAAYELHFGSTKPARATIQAAALPLGARIEIECVGALRTT
jgi:2-iminobutanoate/2-iminopropanoate deaminase